MAQKDGSTSKQLQKLGGRLQQWREAHAPRARLPEELWAAAVALAGQAGIYRTAGGLHLDYASLKRKVEGTAFSQRTTTRGQRTMAPRQKATTPGQRATALTGPKRSTASGKSATRLGKSGTASTAFVELLSGSMAADCLIEVEEAGGRMRIQLKLTAPEVLSLVRDWRAAASERRADGPA